MKKAIAYYRVSTAHQDKRGYGMDIQRVAVLSFASANDYQVLEEIEEVGSSVDNHRVAFQKALDLSRKENATIIVAKLDRLSRSVLFVAQLVAAEVPFKIVDNPNDDEIHLYLSAVLAQDELKKIRVRTKAGLQAAKLKGVQLGKQGKYVLAPQNKAAADAFARLMEPVLRELEEKGITTVRGITKALNKRRKPTFWLFRWHPTTVHRLLCRLKQMNQSDDRA